MADEELPQDDMYSTPVEMLPDDVPSTRTWDPSENRGADYDFGSVQTEGEPLKAHDAMRRMRKRLPFSRTLDRVVDQMGGNQSAVFTRNSQGIVAEITRKLLDRIPEHLWTKEFLDNVDLRPLLQEVMISPAQVENPEGEEVINDTPWTEQERAYAAVILTDETKRVEKRIMDSLLANVPDQVKNDKNHPAVLEAMNIAATVSSEWRENKDTRLPTPAALGETYYNAETGTYQATDSARESGNLSDTASTIDLTTGIDTMGLTPTKFLSAKDVRRLMTAGDLNIDIYGSLETDPADLRGLLDGEVPEVSSRGNIMYTGEFGPSRMGVPEDSLMGQMLGTAGTNPHEGNMVEDTRDWYTVRDILAKPGEMSREELLEVHKKLEAAGLYALVGGEPQVPGDSTDPAFKAAWKMLASMSLEKGESMVSILAERTTAYQQELESALSVSLTDPARLRINADVYARSAIGRNLRPEEQEELIKMLHDMERRNARMEAGLNINSGELGAIEGVDELDEATMFDIDAQMEEWMERSEEAGARDIAETYDSFTRLLGGPGRGGSFG